MLDRAWSHTNARSHAHARIHMLVTQQGPIRLHARMRTGSTLILPFSAAVAVSVGGGTFGYAWQKSQALASSASMLFRLIEQNNRARIAGPPKGGSLWHRDCQRVNLNLTVPGQRGCGLPSHWAVSALAS